MAEEAGDEKGDGEAGVDCSTERRRRNAVIDMALKFLFLVVDQKDAAVS